MSDYIAPSFPALLQAAIESYARDQHVALPGKVVQYDNALQVADIRPMVKRAVPVDDEGGHIAEELPVIPSVPVCFPRGGGFFVSFPVTAGDTGLLVFCERDITAWRTTGENSDPGDLSMHDLSNAVFFPGLHTRAGHLTDASGSTMKLGKNGGLNVTITSVQAEVGGNTDSAALASKVDALIAAFNAHTHTSAAPASPTSPPVSVPGSIPVAGTSASSKLKLGG